MKPALKQEDCATLRDLMARVAGEPARMWGTSIVGFGVRRYELLEVGGGAGEAL